MQRFAHADPTVYHSCAKFINIPSGRHRERMRVKLRFVDIEANARRVAPQHDKKLQAENICPDCCSGQPVDKFHVVL